jgi:hypothetical protein
MGPWKHGGVDLFIYLLSMRTLLGHFMEEFSWETGEVFKRGIEKSLWLRYGDGSREIRYRGQEQVRGQLLWSN